MATAKKKQSKKQVEEKPADTSRDAAKLLRYYRLHPATWVEHHIKIDLARFRPEQELVEWLDKQPAGSHLWARQQLALGKLNLDHSRSYQVEMLEDMAAPGYYALQCANGIAKTCTAALMVLWFLDCFPGGKVLTTAGTWSQLKEQLWREIPMWAERTKIPIVPAQKHLYKTGIDIAPDWAAFSRAASRADTFEGVHGEYIMVVVDEAKAVKAEIFDAVRRILRGNIGCKFWFLCLSSPGSPTGKFYDITNGSQAKQWGITHLSAYESERISLDQIAQDAEDLGESSPLFVAMDLGIFPDEGEDTIVPLSWAQAAVGRVVNEEGAKTLGVDVARYGSDFSALVELRGRKARIVATYQGKSTVWTTGKITEAHMLSPYDAIMVDDSGLGGGVTDQLHASALRRIVRGVNFGSVEDMFFPERYVNAKAEMMFMVRAELEAGFKDPLNPEVGLSLPDDKLLVHQLSMQKYLFDNRQRYRVESHEQLKARGEKSPDRADGLILANYGRAFVARRGGKHLTAPMSSAVEDGHVEGIAAGIVKADF